MKANVDVSSFGSHGISQNRFDILGKLNIEVNDGPSTSRQAAKDANKSKNGEENTGRPIRKKFCPPIILHNVNVNKLVDQLNSRTPKVVYKIINSSRNKSKIYFEDLSAHLEMMELLRAQSIKSYSFTPPELRRVSVILRGLYHLTEVSEIETALKADLPNTIEKVSKLVTQYSAKNDYDTGLFIVTLAQGKKINDVSRLRYILNQSITWESPKTKKREIQCFRCQSWGHSARNCNSIFKCVKCNLNHEPGKCTVKKGESSPTCVNCNESGHAANYRGCPSYKTYLKNKKVLLDKVKNRREAIKENVKSAISSSQAVNEKTSFASLFYSDDRSQTVSKQSVSDQNLPPIVAEFIKLGEYFREYKPQSLESKILNFLNSYKLVPLSLAKQEYGNLMNEVMSHYGPK